LSSYVSGRLGDRRARHVAAAALAAATIAAGVLAGCGGGGSTTAPAGTSAAAPRSTTSGQASTTSTGSDSGSAFGREAPKGHTVFDALDAVLVSGDPAKACAGAYVTSHYLSAAYGGKQGCERATSSRGTAKSFDIKGLVGGPRLPLTVQVMPKGGIYDGEALRVDLVTEGRYWKVDSIKSNAGVGP
jgi:hypothetical protein